MLILVQGSGVVAYLSHFDNIRVVGALLTGVLQRSTLRVFLPDVVTVLLLLLSRETNIARVLISTGV